MKKLIKKCYYFLFLTGIVFNFFSVCHASDTTCMDTSLVQVREFKPSRIGEFKNDKDFYYDITVPPDESFFSIWLNKLLRKLFGITINKNTATFWEIVIYIFCALVLLYVVLKLLKTDISSIFFKKKETKKIEFTELSENIHEMDLEALIRDAINAHQYRKAVRLFYLLVLKELSNKEFINWTSDKTNQDYINELKNVQFKNEFKGITLIFEYIWYGNFTMDESKFKEVHPSFEKFISRIRKGI